MVSNLYQSSWNSLDWILPFPFELGRSLKSLLVQRHHKGAWYIKDGSSTLQLKGSAPRDLKIFIKCYITTWVAVNPTTFLWLAWFPTWGVSSLVFDFLCSVFLSALVPGDRKLQVGCWLMLCIQETWVESPTAKVFVPTAITPSGSFSPAPPPTCFNTESASTGFQGHLGSRTHGLYGVILEWSRVESSTAVLESHLTVHNELLFSAFHFLVLTLEMRNLNLGDGKWLVHNDTCSVLGEERWRWPNFPNSYCSDHSVSCVRHLLRWWSLAGFPPKVLYTGCQEGRDCSCQPLPLYLSLPWQEILILPTFAVGRAYDDNMHAC